MSPQEKDALFPLPRPKTRHTLVQGEFVLLKGHSPSEASLLAAASFRASRRAEPAKDHSVLVIAILLISLVLAILTLIVLVN